MLILRRPDTAQGSTGFWQSGDSWKTRTADAEVARVVDGIRGQAFFSTMHELIDLFAGSTSDVEEKPLDLRVFLNARELLESLPHGYALPEIALEPDSEIVFDWIRPDRTIVSVSIGGGRELSFAARLRTGSAHGVIRRDVGFPQRLAELLRHLYYPA